MNITTFVLIVFSHLIWFLVGYYATEVHNALKSFYAECILFFRSYRFAVLCAQMITYGCLCLVFDKKETNQAMKSAIIIVLALEVLKTNHICALSMIVFGIFADFVFPT